MENTYHIWVPSLQKFHRFRELTLQHGFILHKAGIVSEIELLFALSDLLKELSFDKDLNIDKISILDKYVIFIYLRMLCSGTKMAYTLTCPECEESTAASLDLNELIIPLKDIIDKKYQASITSGKYTFVCDIPSLEKERNTMLWYSEKDISQYDRQSIPINKMVKIVLNLSEIFINNNPVSFSKLNIDDQMKIVQSIPFYHTTQMEKNFIRRNIDIITQTEIFHCKCSNEKCTYNHAAKLDSINSILKIILTTSHETYFSEIAHFSKNYGIPPNFTEHQTISDLQILYEYLNRPQARPQETTQHPSFDAIE